MSVTDRGRLGQEEALHLQVLARHLLTILSLGRRSLGLPLRQLAILFIRQALFKQELSTQAFRLGILLTNQELLPNPVHIPAVLVQGNHSRLFKSQESSPHATCRLAAIPVPMVESTSKRSVQNRPQQNTLCAVFDRRVPTTTRNRRNNCRKTGVFPLDRRRVWLALWTIICGSQTRSAR